MAPQDVWPALLQRANGRTSDHAALEALSLVECKKDALTVRLVDPSAVALVKNRMAWITEQACDLAGAKVTLEVQGLAEEALRERDEDPALAHKAMEDPVVRKATELFDARVAGVRPRTDKE